MAAAIPEWIKISSQFVHPIVQTVLFGVVLYTLYLGIKIRQTRTAQGEEKKELVKGRFAIRHHQISSVVLALVVISAFSAMAVTYINSGKLFLGPHLIVGLTTAALLVTSASLVPFMQRGNLWARNSHITLNIGVVALFGWQLVTGLQIVQKILNRLSSTSAS